MSIDHCRIPPSPKLEFKVLLIEVRLDGGGTWFFDRLENLDELRRR